MDPGVIGALIAGAGLLIKVVADMISRARAEGRAAAQAEAVEKRLLDVERLSEENGRGVDHAKKNIAVLFERTNVVITAPKR